MCDAVSHCDSDCFPNDCDVQASLHGLGDLGVSGEVSVQDYAHFLSIFIHVVHMCAYVLTHAVTNMWRSDDNFLPCGFQGLRFSGLAASVPPAEPSHWLLAHF